MERVKKLVVVPYEKEQDLYNKKHTTDPAKEKQSKREPKLPLTKGVKRYVDKWSYVT